MPDYHFGSFPDIPEGTQFSDRGALRQAKIHLAPVAGIDGNPKIGASSIVLNGGYVKLFGFEQYPAPR
jgi:putative restriction endonuclease